MDEVILLYEAFLSKLYKNYITSLSQIPTWKMDSYLPKELKHEDFDTKTGYLIQHSFDQGFLIRMIRDDLMVIKEIKDVNSLAKMHLKCLTVDDRALEAIGFREEQKKEFYQFTDEVSFLIQGS